MTNPVLLHETKSHGFKDYPIEYYINDIPESYRHMEPHWHEEFEITLTTKGHLQYMIGQTHFEVSEGDLLLIAPDTLHAAQQMKDQRAQTTTIVFSLNMVGAASEDRCTLKYIQPFAEHKVVPSPVVKPGDPLYDEILQCYMSLWAARDIENGKELLVKSILFHLMYLVWKLSPERKSDYYSPEFLRNIERLKPVLTYIHSHYADPLTIDQLAAISGFSSVHFMNLFKKILNTSCLDYILNYRISAATEALKDTDAPIMKVAMDHGFRNISYFNRKFKVKMGCTPSEYRKQVQK